MNVFERRSQMAILQKLRFLTFWLLIAAFALSWNTSSPAQELSAEHDNYLESPVTDSDKDHWSLKPLTDVVVPASAFSNWCRNAIDHFIASELEQHRLIPQPEPVRRILIRRVSLGLTGLLPTTVEVDNFLTDDLQTRLRK